jgi:glycosyltransferase involved in cell wall biosynthesis
VLIVHDAYKHRGGEDNVVDSEIEMLREHGHDLHVYRRHNDEVDEGSSLSLVLQTIWSQRTASDIAQLIAQFRPEVIHAHNTFPLVSPSLYWAATRAGIPVVQTLHNFRLICVQAMLLRGGRVCEDCVGKAPWRGVLHRCYRGSTRQSAVLGSMLSVHRALGTFRDHVARYIALTEFSRRKFVEGGLPPDRISVKPNFVDISRQPHSARTGALFVGRLSEEKGISVLLKALELCPGFTCCIVGDGPEAHRLQPHLGAIAFGWKSREGVLNEMHRARYLVVPSICSENFPLVIVEGFACGLPVIASRRGAMAELIEEGRTGLLFNPGSAEDLATKLRWAEANPERIQQMGRNARSVYEAKYTPSENYVQLRAVYAAAIASLGRGNL